MDSTDDDEIAHYSEGVVEGSGDGQPVLNEHSIADFDVGLAVKFLPQNAFSKATMKHGARPVRISYCVPEPKTNKQSQPEIVDGLLREYTAPPEIDDEGNPVKKDRTIIMNGKPVKQQRLPNSILSRGMGMGIEMDFEVTEPEVKRGQKKYGGLRRRNSSSRAKVSSDENSRPEPAAAKTTAGPEAIGYEPEEAEGGGPPPPPPRRSSGFSHEGTVRPKTADINHRNRDYYIGDTVQIAQKRQGLPAGSLQHNPRARKLVYTPNNSKLVPYANRRTKS